ncbi:MAG: hypothetical protein KA978_06740 [Deltaproteobacteria bacterium]|nr:hypothetical protein [Deltaproteobacteria bacterium]
MLARALIVVVCTLALINIALLASARSLRLDARPVDIQTRDVLRARVSTLERSSRVPQVAFVGDSLVFAQHLEATHGARWDEHTVAAQYARLSRRSGRGAHVVNLGINGVLFRELDCVVAEVLARRPSLLFINVSPRPFAGDFVSAGDATPSERGLCPAATRPLDRLISPLRDEAFERVPILRYRDLAHLTLLTAPPRLAAVTATRRALGLAGGAVEPAPSAPATDTWDDAASEEDAAVLREMAWRVRAARRYDSIEVSAAHPQAAFLRALFARLASATATRSVVFYLEEDMTRLSEQVDVPHFERQRDAFIAMLEGLARPSRVTFRAVRREEIGPHYHDQVHLEVEGYLRLASLLHQSAAGAPR